MDIELRMCSFAARGMLADLMCLMWPTGGKFTPNKPKTRENTLKTVAVMLGSDIEECRQLITELEENGRIFFDPKGILCCKKLIEITKKKQLSSRYGREGGNPNLKGGVNPTVKGEG